MRISRESLAVLLIRTNLNGIQLAKKSGLSRGTITAIKNGKSCSRESAERIAKALGVDVTDIMEDAGIDNGKGF